MGLRSTKAVVSKTMRMSDSSKLVTLITERYGLVTVSAKGARRPKSIFGAALEPVTLIQCMYYFHDNREIQTLTNAEIIEDFSEVKTDLILFSIASAVVEIAQTHTAVCDPTAGTFPLVVESLNGLKDAKPEDASKHLWRFVLKLISATGYKPILDECLACGKKPRGGTVFFSVADGGLICSCTDTRDKFGFMVSPGSLMSMKRLMKGPVDDITRLKVNLKQTREIEDVVMKFLAYHSGSSRLPRSLAFLRKLELSTKDNHN